MPADESVLKVFFMGRFHSKVVYQKFVFFRKLETITGQKLKKKDVNHVSTTNQIDVY